MQKVAHKFEGKTFSRLTVIKRLENHVTPSKTIFSKWLCKCECGNEASVLGVDLKAGKVRSCGCLFIETTKIKGLNNKKHGGYSENSEIDYQLKYRCLRSLKNRARHRGYESDLEISDLPEIGNFCPVFGIKYEKGKTGRKTLANRPSIDRKNSNLPYLKKYKNNLFFISHRANQIKSNASISDLEKIINYMKMGNLKSSLIDSKPGQTVGNEGQVERQPERLNEKTA